MRTHLNRILATSAILCASVALASACTVVQEDTSTDGGGVSGAGGTGATGGTGGSAGASGTAGSAGASGTGGTAGASGTGGTAGTGGSAGTDGGACFGDTPTVNTTPDCNDLPFAGGHCDDGDGGTADPTGVSFCNYLSTRARPGVFDAYYLCVNDLQIQDGCSAAYETAVQGCVDSTFGNACLAPPFTFDGGSVSCADVAAACPADTTTAGVTEQQCQDTINGFDEATRTNIYYCFFPPEANGWPPRPDTYTNGDCAKDFNYCAFAIDSFPDPTANDGG